MNMEIQNIFNALFLRYPALEGEKEKVKIACKILIECFESGGKVLTCGNGGSAADAGHITAELMKGFLLPRFLKKNDLKKFSRQESSLAQKLQYGLPAISLAAQSELVTALSNDNGAEIVFAQQVFVYGKRGDVLIAISTSGNSENVVNAARVARNVGLKVVALTGKTGGGLKEFADTAICVPEEKVYRIQEYHLPIYHALCSMVEQYFFGEQLVDKDQDKRSFVSL